MTTLTIYDPAMCCSTGLCGTEIDQRLVDLAADLDWLKTQGVSVRRFGLSREPAEFAANDTIRQIMQASDGDDLPVFMLDDALKAKARYPSRAEMAEWAGITTPKLEITEQVRELISLGAAIGSSCEPCLKYHVKKSRELGLNDAAMREAIAIGLMVKEASGKNIHGLADKLIPDEDAADTTCCGNPSEATKTAPEKEKTGACC